MSISHKKRMKTLVSRLRAVALDIKVANFSQDWTGVVKAVEDLERLLDVEEQYAEAKK